MKKLTIILTCLAFLGECKPNLFQCKKNEYTVWDFFKNAIFGYKTETIINTNELIVELKNNVLNIDAITVYTARSELCKIIEGNDLVFPNALIEDSSDRSFCSFETCTKKNLFTDEESTQNSIYKNTYSYTKKDYVIGSPKSEKAMIYNFIKDKSNKIKVDEIYYYVKGNISEIYRLTAPIMMKKKVFMPLERSILIACTALVATLGVYFYMRKPINNSSKYI